MEIQQSQSPSPQNGIPQQERQWAMFAHLSALAIVLIPIIGSILGPLIMFLIKKDEYQFGTDQAKEALNFNISCLIYGVISFVLMFVVIGFFLMFAVAVFWLVMIIIAAVRSNEGAVYRYPLCLRFIS